MSTKKGTCSSGRKVPNHSHQGTSPMSTIAVCVFMTFNSNKYEIEVKKPPSSLIKLYTYFNLSHVSPNELCLVHNGAEFGVVKILHNASIEDHPHLVAKTKKPLLGVIYPSASTSTRLEEMLQVAEGKLLALEVTKLLSPTPAPTPAVSSFEGED